jgi:hypothetical protein
MFLNTKRDFTALSLNDRFKKHHQFHLNMIRIWECIFDFTLLAGLSAQAQAAEAFSYTVSTSTVAITGPEMSQSSSPTP